MSLPSLTARILAVVLLAVPAFPQGNGYAETILYNFTGVNGNGTNPQAGLVMDSSGNLYGTTAGGGNIGCASNITYCGTVFKLDGTRHESILYQFTTVNGDGYWPFSGLVMDSSGNLYGTTNAGGEFNWGTIFKVDAAGQETVLYSFNNTGIDATQPTTGLIRDSAGNLYGTTADGGGADAGAVFKLDPAGNETLLYSFKEFSDDGRNPSGGLIMDSAGNLYGTTLNGGSALSNGGTLFKLDTTGHETVLYSFTGANGDGVGPIGSLVMDSAGNLYGATALGGSSGGACSSGCGTIFKLDNTGHETILYRFTGTNGDGAAPQGDLIIDNAGNLYGVTPSGGTGCPPPASGYLPGCGTVFKLDNTGQETVIYAFAGNNDGHFPYGRLISDSAGSLYGTTYLGGSAGSGTVFKLMPVPDFLFNAAAGGSTSASTSPGQSVTYNLEVSSVNGFAGSVSLACGRSPGLGISCEIPAGVSVNAGSSAQFMVTVTTVAGTLASGGVRPPPSSNPQRSALISLAIFLPFMGAIQLCSQRRKRNWFIAAVLLWFAASLISCGGGGGAGAGTATAATPPGDYTVIINGTSNGVTHTFNLDLTVN